MVTRRLPWQVEEKLRSDYDAEFNASDMQYSPEQLLAMASGKDAIVCSITDKLDNALIQALPESVKIVATFSVGFDHIDVAAAKARGIAVTNTPGALTEATADIAFLLLLGAARRAYEGQSLLRRGEWEGWAPTQLMGTELYGKRLGIAGMGRIGQAVARRALAFGLTVHYFDRAPCKVAGLAATFHESDESFLSHSDFLSLHMAATPETRFWLNARRIAALPRGAIIVNTARGDLVNDDALIAALESGHIAAAGLDVFAGEPNLDARYLRITNAMLLPHLGSATVESRCGMGFRALANLNAFFAGQSPPDLLA